MDERKRDSIVAYLQRRMAQAGITIEALAAALGHDDTKFLSATGETWDGEGEMPPWLQQAVSAGQSLEHFAAAPAAVPGTVPVQAVANARRSIDWSQDPFAGSPLATTKA